MTREELDEKLREIWNTHADIDDLRAAFALGMTVSEDICRDGAEVGASTYQTACIDCADTISQERDRLTKEQ